MSHRGNDPDEQHLLEVLSPFAAVAAAVRADSGHVPVDASPTRSNSTPKTQLPLAQTGSLSALSPFAGAGPTFSGQMPISAQNGKITSSYADHSYEQAATVPFTSAATSVHPHASEVTASSLYWPSQHLPTVIESLREGEVSSDELKVRDGSLGQGSRPTAAAMLKLASTPLQHENDLTLNRVGSTEQSGISPSPLISPSRSSHPSGVPRRPSSGALPAIAAPNICNSTRAASMGHTAAVSHTTAPASMGWASAVPSHAQLQAAVMQALQPSSGAWQGQALFQQPPIVPAGLLGQVPSLAQQEAALQALQASAVSGGDVGPDYPGWADYPGSGLLRSPQSLTPRPSLDAATGTPSGGASLEEAVLVRRSNSVGGVARTLSADGNVFPLAPIFPAARYSTSLESRPGSDGTSQEYRRIHLGGNSFPSDSAASLLQRLQLSAQRLPPVRALLGLGGRFVAGAGRDMAYEGGEVRLVSIPEGATFAELVAVLAKTDKPARTSSQEASAQNSASSSFRTPTRGATTPPVSAGQRAAMAIAAAAALEGALHGTDQKSQSLAGGPRFCVLRYQLPSDPSVYVDVVDDEDVRLMFEEYAEHRATEGG